MHKDEFTLLLGTLFRRGNTAIIYVCMLSPLLSSSLLPPPPAPVPPELSTTTTTTDGARDAEGGGGTSRAENGDGAPCPAAASAAVGAPPGVRLPAGSWHEADMTPPLPDDVSALSIIVSHMMART